MKKEAMKFTDSAVELFKGVYDISGGGLAPVDTLPEKGDVGTLYKTPDGNIYSWFHEETQKEVEVPPTLEVGKTYELKEQISIETFVTSINNALQDPERISSEKSISGDIVSGDLSFYMEFSINSGSGLILSSYEVLFTHLVEGDDKIRYYYSDNEEREDDYVHRRINGWTGSTEITVTQEWVDNLNEDWGAPFDINNLNFLFVGTTETVTVVNEGYTQLNGIVLDYDKIINNAIFLDDKNYDAQIIYDTLLRGGSILLRVTQDADAFDISNLKNTHFEYNEGKLHNLTITFSDYDETTINVILENQFNPISTIKGQELIDLIQAYGPMEINNASLIDYINSTLSFEETNKELYRGIAISLFEGLVEYQVFYTLPIEELAPSTVTQIANFDTKKASTSTVLNASEGQQLYLEFLAQNIGDAYTPNDVVNNIITDKDYNCDIVVKFSDGTTKTIPMDKSVLYGNGFETSPLFRIHYLN